MTRVPGPVAVVGISLASLATGTFALASVGVLAPDLRPALGLSTFEIGLFSSLCALGAATVSHQAGKLTDTRGAAPVLGLSVLGFGLSMVFVAGVGTAWALLGAAFFAGVCYGGVNPPTNVMIAGRLSQRLGLFLSIKQSGVPLGALLAGLVLPAVSSAWGWRWAIALAALLLLLTAAATPLVRGAAVVRMKAGADFVPLRRSEMVVLGSFAFVMSGVQWALLTYTTLYMTDDLRFSHVAAGGGLALAQVLGIAGRLTWGGLLDRTGQRLPYLLGIACATIVCLALFAVGPGRVWVWPLLAASGFAIVGWNGAFHALVAERGGPGRIGRVSGTILVFIFAGSVFFPPVSGRLVDAFGSWRPLYILGAVCVAIAVTALWLGLRSDSTATTQEASA